MITQDLCEYLESRISAALEASDDERLKGFWCDGVSPPDSETVSSLKTVNDRRQLTMTAFAGKTGQDRYELTLTFGPKALSRHARGLSLESCIPDAESTGWFSIDPTRKTMQIRLS